jgi:hypothetical protein
MLEGGARTGKEKRPDIVRPEVWEETVKRDAPKPELESRKSQTKT